MGWFSDPLARRELSGVARRWQHFAARGVLGLIMAWAVFYLWDRSAWAHAYGGTSAMSSLSREVFVAYFAGLMIFLPLLAAASAGDLVPREVRNGTLGLLFLTPLTPWRIVLGKWKAAMAQILLILLAGGPIAAICVYLGGVGPEELLWGAVLPFATAAFAGAVALFVSTFFRGLALTLIVSILALLAGIIGPVWILVDGFTMDGFRFIVLVHPVFAGLVAAEPRVGIPSDTWPLAAATAVAGALILIGLAAWRLPGRLNVPPGPSLMARMMARLDGFYESINVGRVRVLARSGEVWEGRALLWKELRTRASGKLRHATRFALGLLVLAVLPFLGSDDVLHDWMAVFVWVFSGLLVLQAVVGGVSLFVHEREGRQLDVLLATPLTSHEILMSKLTGGLSSLAPTSVIMALYLGAVAVVHPNGGELFGLALVPSGLFALFAYLLSAGASLRARTQRGAFGTSMGILLGLLVGIPAALGALDALGMRIDEDDVLAMTNPAAYLMYASAGMHRYAWGYVDRWDGSYLVIYLFLYGAACAALLVWMRASFDRLAGRV